MPCYEGVLRDTFSVPFKAILHYFYVRSLVGGAREAAISGPPGRWSYPVRLGIVMVKDDFRDSDFWLTASARRNADISVKVRLRNPSLPKNTSYKVHPSFSEGIRRRN